MYYADRFFEPRFKAFLCNVLLINLLVIEDILQRFHQTVSTLFYWINFQIAKANRMADISFNKIFTLRDKKVSKI